MQSCRVPDASAAPLAGVSHTPLADDPDDGDDDGDDDDDDRDSSVSVTVDRSAVRLATFVYDCYPGSHTVLHLRLLLAVILRPCMPWVTPRSPPIRVLLFT